MIIDVPEFKDGVVLFGHGDEGDCDHAGRHDNDDEDCDVERNYHDIVAVMVASFCTMMLISHTHTHRHLMFLWHVSTIGHMAALV